jgi:hypothetical protein
MARYGSIKWQDEVEGRHLQDLASKAPRLRALKIKHGVLDAGGAPTGKRLTNEEAAELMAEADAIARG